MYSNLEGFLKDWEYYIKEKVEHKHQVSMQCAREAAAETEIERIKKKIEGMYFPDEKQLECQKVIIQKLNLEAKQ